MANCGCCGNNDKAEDKRHTPFELAQRVQYAPDSVVSSQLADCLLYTSPSPRD